MIISIVLFTRSRTSFRYLIQMFHVILVFVLIYSCSSTPLQVSDWSTNKPFERHRLNIKLPQSDDSEVVDHTGSGYSFFKKQQIDVRPFPQPNIPLLNQDLLEYMKSSALKPSSMEKIASSYENRGTNEVFGPRQQPSSSRFSQMTSSANLPSSLSPTHRNAYGQISQPDVQTWSSQQRILIPQTKLNSYSQNQQDGFRRQIQRADQQWNQFISKNPTYA